ncbi:hypothetical protein [Micromonospora narathiwatensis]|uniref:Uncharacterized protein n=1 Tax=Micromonospora narathiwatensis TaxID=299146 RepID=A0A1A9AG57_9ACTN|nr:hypothetical protein [Micromonospora narathiwatensis]SBT55128.1 hypothetical protein GA0070621_5913 [Micromonospora narathiwatensis]
MQPVGPYRFTEALGVCQVGTAWWAVDGQDRLVTVAVLAGAAATDQPWREAFANAANAMALTPGGQRYANADFAAAEPWVAYPSEEGMGAQRLFQTLGMELHPAESEAEVLITETGAAADLPQPSPEAPTSGAPSPTSGSPLPWAMHAAVPQQVSPAPLPVSAAPQQVSPAPMSGHPQPVSVPPPDPFSTPVRRITPSAPPRRRTGLWIGIAAVVLVVLAGAGGLAVLTSSGDDKEKPENTASASSAPPLLPTTPPESPGVEPPKPGAWPTQWPKFKERDTVRTLNLDGLGFPVKMPTNWQCTLAGRAEGFVKYQCGTSATGDQAVGGEVIVRNCPQPCNEQWQSAMRGVEEAWGTQWIRSGEYASYAEKILDVDGGQRHGLIVVAYFRSGEDGAIDRQLVIRMTSPVPEAYQLRRFANYVRDVVVF